MEVAIVFIIIILILAGFVVTKSIKSTMSILKKMFEDDGDENAPNEYLDAYNAEHPPVDDEKTFDNLFTIDLPDDLPDDLLDDLSDDMLDDLPDEFSDEYK